MKKFTVMLLSLSLLFCFVSPVFAADLGETISIEEQILDNGLRMVDTVTVYSTSRANLITAHREKEIYDGNTLVAYIRFEARFRYDGSTVSVLSKTVTNTETYDGWEYVQNSFTASNGTVTLDAKITKWFIFNAPFTMTISCDKDGNISYT